MLRPITRRWGICFRSTQRYTVCWLTPRNLAASRTVSGYSSSEIKVCLFGRTMVLLIASPANFAQLQLVQDSRFHLRPAGERPQSSKFLRFVFKFRRSQKSIVLKKFFEGSEARAKGRKGNGKGKGVKVQWNGLRPVGSARGLPERGG